jgi:type II secretory pathway pseudopilin PulG
MKKALPLLFLVALPLFSAEPAASPTDAERARWTMSDMRSIATAIEAYATDHNRYPDAKDIADVAKAVQPMYIRSTPLRDAWGNNFRIESNASGYRIVSCGSDGVCDTTTWAVPAKDLGYSADAVTQNGKMIRSWTYGK